METTNIQSKSPRKRKPDSADDNAKARKKTKLGKAHSDSTPSYSVSQSPTKSVAQRVTLKLPPNPKEQESFPCCLCVSSSRNGLLKVQDPPLWIKEGESTAPGSNKSTWYAHEECANVVPETWVDEVEVDQPDGIRGKQRIVFGVDAVVKDRWNLVCLLNSCSGGVLLSLFLSQKCTACTKPRSKSHGAPIQCTKGKCPKAFHVSCARDGHSNGIIYEVLSEVEKEVVLMDPQDTAGVVAPATSSNLEKTDQGSCLEVAPVAMALDEPLTVSLPMESAEPSPVQPPSSPEPRVLKVIRKTEVKVLCSQHNPVS